MKENKPLVDKKWTYRILIMLVFLFAFGIRAYNLSEKKGFHVDEHWSFILSEYKEVGWTEDLPAGVYTAGELRAMVYAPRDPSFKGALKDVFRLWEDNRDSPHTNLYYSALRLSLVGVVGSESLIDDLIFRAGLLNLITFAGCFVAFFFLLKTLVPKRSFILLGLIVLSLNPLDIGNVLLFRPYMLQTMFVSFFVAHLIYVAKKIEVGKYEDSWQNLMKFAFVLSFMLLTGYYSFIFAFFVGIFFVIACLWKNKKLNLVPFFFMGSLLAVAFCAVYYQSFFKGFYEYRTTELLDSVSSFSDKVALSYDMFVGFKLGWALLLIPLFVVISICIYIKRELPLFRFVRKYAWVMIATTLAILFVMFVSTLKSPRYVVPFMPCVLVFVPLLCEGLRNKKCRIWAFSLVGLGFVAMALMSVSINKILRTNYCYESVYESSSDIKSPVFRQDIPVYLTAHTYIDESVVNIGNAARIFPLLYFGESQKVVVSDITLPRGSKEAKIAVLQKEYDIPEEFIMFYTRRKGGYRNYVHEDRP